MANRPIKQYKAGNISGAIWFNEKEKDNQVIGFKTVSLRRSWKDKDTWRDETINLRKTDIPKIMIVLNKIHEDLILNQEDENND